MDKYINNANSLSVTTLMLCTLATTNYGAPGNIIVNITIHINRDLTRLQITNLKKRLAITR